ncbi:hypothetical protein EW145_g2282 [Phellinidium pouzarii]|uniref:RRM domain-containing protein n=1 Tax=Phellinidium pouzarii TaxID=167371 RepID=A0A4S4LBM7_9AGAM|nr:hypothetical protein EW145_g2282 [Phellinidium pouzarii]
MQLGHAKRPGHSPDLEYLTSKRFKREDSGHYHSIKSELESDADLYALQRLSKPLTCGVERVPYPAQCRPFAQNCDWHRRQIIKDVTARLAEQGKCTIGFPRFLDDGITFDWVLDKSIMDMDLGERSSPKSTETPMEVAKEAVVNNMQNAGTICSADSGNSGIVDLQDEFLEIPGFNLFKSENTSLHVLETSEASIVCEAAPSTATPVEEEVLGSKIRLPSLDGAGIEDAPGISQVVQKFRISPSFELAYSEHIASVAPSTSKIKENFRHPLPEKPLSTTSASERTVSSGLVSLWKIDWPNYKEIIFIKGLARTSTIEDVYVYLQINGYPFAEIKDVQLHTRTSAKQMASIQFSSPQLARDALLTLQSSKLPFPIPSEGSSVVIKITTEPCRMPHLKTYSARSTVSAMASAPSLSTPVSSRLQAQSIELPLRKPSPISVLPRIRPLLSRSDILDRPSSIERGSVSASNNPIRPFAKDRLSFRNNLTPSERDAINQQPEVLKCRRAPSPVVIEDSESPSNDETDDDDSIDSNPDEEAKDNTSTSGSDTDSDFVSVQDEARNMRGSRSRQKDRKNIAIGTVKEERIANLSLPSESEGRCVEDACLIRETAVLGYSRGDRQVSIVTQTNKIDASAAKFSLSELPHSDKGISCLAPFLPSNSIEFLSGGSDKTVKRWRVSQTLPDSDDERGRPPVYSTTIRPFGGPLNSRVTSLVYHAAAQRVLCAAGKRLWTLDLEGRNLQCL